MNKIEKHSAATLAKLIESGINLVTDGNMSEISFTVVVLVEVRKNACVPKTVNVKMTPQVDLYNMVDSVEIDMCGFKSTIKVQDEDGTPIWDCLNPQTEEVNQIVEMFNQ